MEKGICELRFAHEELASLFWLRGDESLTTRQRVQSRVCKVVAEDHVELTFIPAMTACISPGLIPARVLLIASVAF